MPTDETNGLGGVIDTSTLGPVRFEPDAQAERARLVREALQKVGREHGGMIVSGAAFILAEQASDEMLSHLGRLLK